MLLEIENLSQKYGDFVALNSISFQVEEGVYGILGPNGAGKSTFMNLLTDNVLRTSGSISLDGKDILNMGEAYRDILGYMPQQQGYYEDFSVTEFLKYIGSLKGKAKKELNNIISELLTRLNLEDVRNKKMKKLSGGMRQRVLFAQALLNNPRILVLDEPTVGLDPKERVNVRNMIKEISQDKIIFVSTHIVSDIENIADKIILLKKGEIVAFDRPDNLISRLPIEYDKNLESVYILNFEACDEIK